MCYMKMRINHLNTQEGPKMRIATVGIQPGTGTLVDRYRGSRSFHSVGCRLVNRNMFFRLADLDQSFLE